MAISAGIYTLACEISLHFQKYHIRFYLSLDRRERGRLEVRGEEDVKGVDVRDVPGEVDRGREAPGQGHPAKILLGRSVSEGLKGERNRGVIFAQKVNLKNNSPHSRSQSGLGRSRCQTAHCNKKEKNIFFVCGEAQTL